MANVIFMGTPQFAVPSLAALHENHRVLAVVTQPDAPSGRGKAITASPVKQYAVSHDIPVMQPVSFKNADAVEALRAYQPDLIIVAAFGQILRQNVLDLPKFHCINVHASLLPRWRGAAPISAAIAAGDAMTGVTIMLMEAGLDSGPMLARCELKIAPDDSTGTLTERLAKAGAALLIETLPNWLNSTIKPQKQEESLVTIAGRIRKEQGKIDWSQRVAQIERHVRAMAPWPSAFTTLQGKQLKILRAAMPMGEENGNGSKLPNGVVTIDRNHAYVQCGDGLLQLLEVQLEGKRAMPADVFLRGFAGLSGSNLG